MKIGVNRLGKGVYYGCMFRWFHMSEGSDIDEIVEEDFEEDLDEDLSDETDEE